MKVSDKTIHGLKQAKRSSKEGLVLILNRVCLEFEIEQTKYKRPENLKTKLIDLGGCVHKNELEAKKFGCEMKFEICTANYRAPEVWCRDVKANKLKCYPKYGSGVDIWALGAVLAELLSGQTITFKWNDDESNSTVNMELIAKTLGKETEIPGYYLHPLTGEALFSNVFVENLKVRRENMLKTLERRYEEDQTFSSDDEFYWNFMNDFGGKDIFKHGRKQQKIEGRLQSESVYRIASSSQAYNDIEGFMQRRPYSKLFEAIEDKKMLTILYSMVEIDAEKRKSAEELETIFRETGGLFGNSL